MSIVLSENAKTIFRTLYYSPNETSPEDVFSRVADCIADDSRQFMDFMNILANHIFRPNTPCMINAKKPTNETKNHDMNLAACFVLELDDDMESIMRMWETCAKIYAGGGGVGLPLSNLREKDCEITTGGKASGPIKYLEVVQTISDTVKSGGKSRRAANLTSFKFNHPDIKEYITCKKGGKFSAVNISVLVNDEFMSDVKNKRWDKELPLISPYKNKNTKNTTVGEIWKLLVKTAWESGDPGLLFYDEANRHNAFPSLGMVMTSNPCLPGWAPVLTPNGYKHFIDVVNEIYIDGQNRVCSNLIKTGNDRDVYEIILDSGLKVYATEEHKILKYIKENQYEMTELKDLCPGDFLKPDYSPIKYELNIEEFNTGKLCGLVYADGTFIHNHTGFRINIGESLLNQKDDIYNFVQSQFNNKIKTGFYPLSYTDKCQSWDIASKDIFNEFITKFQANNKDDFIIYDKSISYSIGFINALISCDGYIKNSKKHKEIVIQQHGTRGFKLLSYVQLILCSLGIYSNLRQEGIAGITAQGFNTQDKWRLYILDLNEFRVHFDLFNLNKKKELDLAISKLTKTKTQWMNKFKFIKQGIKEINLVEGTHDVYDITVPDGNRFVSSGIVISNCGEVLLADNSMCNLGSINLNKCLNIKDDELFFDFELLKTYTKLAQEFLDNVISKTTYPTEKFKIRMQSERPIGLGLMGLSDIFFKLNLSYGSKESIELFENICKTMTKTAFEHGIDKCYSGEVTCIIIPEKDIEHFIARLEYFGVSDEHISKFKKTGCRNSTVTSIAPTGSISISADCSYAFEPCFALIWSKKLVDRDETLFFVNEIFKEECKARNIELTDELMTKISNNKGSCRNISEIPQDMQEIFVTAHDLGWKKKIEMQKVGQRWITLGISSTCNLPASATIEDVEDAYMLAWESKLKGITVYRDGCLNTQPINFGAQDKKENNINLNELTPMKRPMKRIGTTVEVNTPHGKLYLTGNVDKENRLFEVFMRMGQQGHVTNILLDALGKVMSKSLQYGVPAKALINTMHQCGGFPFYFKLDEDVKKSEQAESIVDGIAKLIDHHFNESTSNICETTCIDSSLKKCPQCGQMTLVIGSGCRGGSCANPECGYSKCG